MKYDDLINRKRVEYGEKFSDASINTAFVDAFNSGKRITVQFKSDKGKVIEEKRGTIGITTGWQPCFLLMLTKRSRGSAFTIGKNDTIKSS